MTAKTASVLVLTVSFSVKCACFDEVRGVVVLHGNSKEDALEQDALGAGKWNTS